MSQSHCERFCCIHNNLHAHTEIIMWVRYNMYTSILFFNREPSSINYKNLQSFLV